jgi:hypothetical protein
LAEGLAKPVRTTHHLDGRRFSSRRKEGSMFRYRIVKSQIHFHQQHIFASCSLCFVVLMYSFSDESTPKAVSLALRAGGQTLLNTVQKSSPDPWRLDCTASALLFTPNAESSGFRCLAPLSTVTRDRGSKEPCRPRRAAWRSW